ncbi:hypothetical protein GCM10009740_12060 [Terrabacter terrae]|uniref:Cupin type-2 domain-containing protein n=1 Tax=Terrabacter terrae TaxID=318434 RepID=A0ABN2TY58_9MICO
MREAHGSGAGPRARSSQEETFESAAWQDGSTFHGSDAPIYSGDATLAHLVKRGRNMAHVAYQPSHPNPHEGGARAGQGTSRCIWLSSEQGRQAEAIAESCLEGMLDTWLEPGASVGWHRHDNSEEHYYLLEGRLDVTVEDLTGQVHTFELEPGDSHRVGTGMTHGSVAGTGGARFICVMLTTTRPASTGGERQ